MVSVFNKKIFWLTLWIETQNYLIASLSSRVVHVKRIGSILKKKCKCGEMRLCSFTSFPSGSALAQVTLTQIRSVTFVLIRHLKSSIKIYLSLFLSNLSKGQRTSNPLHIPLTRVRALIWTGLALASAKSDRTCIKNYRSSTICSGERC